MTKIAEYDITRQEATYYPGSKRHEAVRKAAEQLQARPFMPDLGERLMKGMDLVLSGKVQADGDGFTVQSGSKTYTLDPYCTCKDSEHRSKWCKHAIAAELWNAVQRGEPTPAPENGFSSIEQAPITPAPEPAPEPPTWQHSQAPSSCTLKWSTGGIELMLTLRDSTDDALFRRLKRVLPKIEARMEAQRQARAHQNGHTAPDTDSDWCERHKARMKRYEKGNRVWHSHKLADNSWCNGRQ